MASMVAKATSSSSGQALVAMPVQEKGSRNKRKFRADPPVGDVNNVISMPQNDCSSYEFSAEKSQIAPIHGHPGGCDWCSSSHDHSDALQLDLGLSTMVGSSEAGPKEEIEAVVESHDIDWSDLTESQLEDYVLSNLDSSFKSAIKKIVACGYSEEVATKAVLRSGICYGYKDMVSNIVDNGLGFLRSAHEIDTSREHYFEDLQQMEKYVLAELICFLREFRPFSSIGDAMWYLLVNDMNISLACAVDGDSFTSLTSNAGVNGGNTVPKQPQLTTEARSPELAPKSSPSIACAHTCQCETPAMSSVSFPHTSQSALVKAKSSFSSNGLVQENPVSTSAVVEMPSGAEEKFVGSRKISGISKREYILRQKSLHVEKSSRMHGSRGSSRGGKLGGSVLDKKLKSVSDSSGVNAKNASPKTSTTTEVNVPQDDGKNNGNKIIFNAETVDTESTLPKTIVPSVLPTVTNSVPTLSAADTELSLSLNTKSNPAPVPHDKFLGQRVPHDKKDEIISGLVTNVQAQQNMLQQWSEWANQRVMEAARALSKRRPELKALRQEKEEVERLNKERQTLEENTAKKISELENAYCKATRQVELTNADVRRLESENAVLRKEMEAAKVRAVESAASCQEVVNREKKTLTNFQAWEKQKALLQEELIAEKRKFRPVQEEVEQAKGLRDQLEARWKQEEKAKEELLTQASTIRKERELIEASAKSKEDAMKLNAETNMQKYKDEIKRLEKEISRLRLKSESSKIAALRSGINGSYASRLSEDRNALAPEQSQKPGLTAKLEDYAGAKGVKRERECVMCLSEEISVVFLPCSHQVVCTECNELHEKQGMKDCPSCRTPIQRRVSVRYFRA